MKSKKSFFSKIVFINDLKVYGWLGFTYGAFLFIGLTLPVLTEYIKDGEVSNYFLYNIFRNNNFIMRMLIITFPVIIAIVLFRYLHVNKAYTTIHSYPFTRMQMFNSHISAGICLLVTPLLINGIIVIIINTLVSSSGIRNTEIIKWLLMTILTVVTIYIVSSFIGVIVGASLWQLVFTYIFLILPTGLLLLLKYFFSLLIYGFRYSDYKDYRYLSPILADLGGKCILPFTIYCIVFYLISLYLYEKRHLENSTKLICFGIFQEVFKYGVTFCTMLVVSLFYWLQFNETHSILKLIIAAFIGSSIGYFIAQMLIQKKINVFKYYKGLVIYSVIIVAIIGVIRLDITGYEKRVPSIDTVDSIEYELNNYMLYDRRGYKTYKTQESMKQIINLHNQIIKERPTIHSSLPEYMFTEVTIEYLLNNGKKLKRNYYIKEEDFKSYISSIYETKESKSNKYNELYTNQQNILNISINPEEVNMKPVLIKDSEEVKELTSILKDEIESESYEKMKGSYIIGYFNFYGVDNSGKDFKFNIIIRNNYNKLIGWLEEKGYLKQIIIMPDDIKTLAISLNDEDNKELLQEANEGEYLYINDNAKIQEVLDSRVSLTERYDNIKDILVLYQRNADENTYRFYISVEKAPKFIVDEYYRNINN